LGKIKKGAVATWRYKTFCLITYQKIISNILLSKMNQIQKINSRDNQKLRFARAVRDGRESDWIFVEGLRLSEELMKANLEIKQVLVTSQFLQNARAVKLIQKLLVKNIEISEVEAKIFGSLSDTKNSQGIIVIADKPVTGREVVEKNLTSQPFLLLLHGLNNPLNLGAILRTAEAVEIEGVITTKGTTDVFSQKALRGGMGANLRLPFWTNADFSEVLAWAKRQGIKSVCADIRSQKSYLEIDWTMPRLLVIGSEGHGLSEVERIQTDESLIIPMANGVESLNAAVASGVMLFEAKRQREMQIKSKK
jgi:TrmH family RNA methyltransferase